MSTASVADEIKKLFELFQVGCLTQQEFAEAKQNLIRSIGAAPAAPATQGAAAAVSPAHQEEQTLPAPGAASAADDAITPPPVPPAVQAPSLLDDGCDAHGYEGEDEYILCRRNYPRFAAALEVLYRYLCVECLTVSAEAVEDADPAELLASEYARRHRRQLTLLLFLERIVGNIARSPAQPKFRRLSRANETLRRHVFSVDGGEAFLGAVGFVPADDGDAAGAVALPMPASGAAGQERETLRAALEVLSALRQRLAAYATRHAEARRLIQGGMYGVRRQSVARVLHPGDPSGAEGTRLRLAEHYMETVVTPEVGDDYELTVDRLRFVLAHVRRHAAAASVARAAPGRCLRGMLPHVGALYNALVRTKGVMELLTASECYDARTVDVAALGGNDGGDAAALRGAAPGELLTGAVFCLVPREGGAYDLHFVCSVLETLVERVEQRRLQVLAEKQAAATRAFQKEFRAEKRRRERESTKHEQLAQRPPRAVATADLSDSDDDRVTTHDATGGTGRRIPLKDALAVLMGKKSLDDNEEDED